MRVTFDARHLQTVARVRGIGRYTRNLLAAFARLAPADVEWTLLRLRTFPPADPSPLPPHRDLATVRLRRPELSMLAIDPIALSLELPFTRPDVYHAVQLSLPLAARCRRASGARAFRRRAAIRPVRRSVRSTQEHGRSRVRLRACRGTSS